MNSGLKLTFLLLVFFSLSLAINAKDNISNQCNTVEVAQKQFDIKAMIAFDKTASAEQKQACKKLFPYHSYEQDIDFFTCETLTDSLYRDVYDSLSILQNLKQYASNVTRERCITHTLNSVGPLNNKIFKGLVKDLLEMKPSNQQTILDDLLIFYVRNDKQALKHQNVQTLLELGANPTTPTNVGTPILSKAFWATYVGGGTCKAIRLIIEALSPEDLTTPYPNREGNHPEKNINATPLMAVASLGGYCPDEAILVAKKAADINKQDKNGNTALHHFYLDMGRHSWLIDYQITLVDILRKRGASFEIPNKENITAEQLRLKLKQDKDKCHDLCVKL